MTDKLPADTAPVAFSEKAYPADLIGAGVWLAAGILTRYLPALSETPISTLLILPGILFLPGYCLIAALFPKVSDIDLTERIVLSFGLSIAVVPLTALLLNFTMFGIRLDPILVSLTIFALAMILVAQYRRTLLPSERRFRFPFMAIAHTLQDAIFPKGASRIDRILMVVISMAFIIAFLVTLYVIAVPKEGERFTEFFILGENRTATGYPDRISVGQNYPLYVGIGNHEYRNTNYTIETWLLRMEFNNMTNTSRLIEMDPGDRLAVSLEHDETFVILYNLSVRKTIYNRVEFLLFNDSVPGADVTGNDRIRASYRNVNLWIRQGQSNGD